MMRCRCVLRLVDDVANHRATPIDEARVLEHVASCPACRKALADAEAYTALVGCVPPTAPLNNGFTSATLARIEASRLRPSYWRGLRDRVSAPALGGAALVAAACVALILAAPASFHRSIGTGASIAVESSPMMVASATVEPMGRLQSLSSDGASDDGHDPFADHAVAQLSRAGAGHYMLTGLGL